MPLIATYRKPPRRGYPVLNPLVYRLLDVGEEGLFLRLEQLLGRAALVGPGWKFNRIKKISKKFIQKIAQ